jgi:CO dehydrogenase maturation factor
MVRLLAAAFPQSRILAIDADPAVGLSTALGVEPERTLDDIRREVATEVTQREGGGVSDILAGVRGRLEDAMLHCGGYDFFAIGRPETAGCYCAVNTYLRQVIALLIHEYDYVVVDSEAGVEQVNRRVLEKVTHLIFVTDASKKGTQVVRTVKSVADELVMYEKCGAIVNRVTTPDAMEYVELGDIPLLAVIGEDTEQTEFDILGKSVFDLPDGAEILRGTRQALEKLKIL